MKSNSSIDIKKSGRKAFARVDAFIQEKITKSRYGLWTLRRPFNYLKTFIGDAGVAAIHPSSRYLVTRVVRAVEQGRPRVIVEFGAAEGVMTKKILKSLPHDGILVAIERNPGFFKGLAQIKDARLRTACGDVREMKKLLVELGVTRADCFFSGIPFSFLSPAERAALVHEVYCHLPHGGRFVAYQCTTHLIPLLRRQFQQVKVELELRNIPPHFVFTAIRK